MAVRFLSAEWAEEVTSLVRAHPGFGPAVTGVDLAIAFDIEGAPAGVNGRYYLRIVRDGAVVAIGSLEQVDLTVRTDYATASAISQGDLEIQSAFFRGKLTVSGNVARLVMHQRALDLLADAVSAMEVEY